MCVCVPFFSTLPFFLVGGRGRRWDLRGEQEPSHLGTTSCLISSSALSPLLFSSVAISPPPPSLLRDKRVGGVVEKETQDEEEEEEEEDGCRNEKPRARFAHFFFSPSFLSLPLFLIKNLIEIN